MYSGYAFRLLTRSFAVIVLASLLGLAISALAARSLQTWSTTAQLQLSPSSSEIETRAAAPERFFRTQMTALLSDDVLADASRRLASGSTAADLRGMITAGGGVDSDVMKLTLTAPEQKLSTDATKAVLTAISNSDEAATTKVLSVGQPTTNVATTKMVAAGTLASAFLAALAVLLIGAVRRPLLAPRYVQVNDPAIVTYPLLLRVPGASERELNILLSWLRRDGATEIVLAGSSTPNLARALVQDLQALPAAADTRFVHETSPDLNVNDPEAGTRRMLLHVVAPGESTESAIENHAQAARGFAGHSALLLAKRTK